LPAGHNHRKFEVKKNYKSEGEDLTCDLKTLCVLQCGDIWSVTVIVPVLKFVARKGIWKLCRGIAIV
jgi:hypothetical protein